MIIKFNPTIFTSDSPEIQLELQKIIIEFLEDRFLWDIDNLSDIFPLDAEGNIIDNDFIINTLNPIERKRIKEKMSEIYGKSAYISQVHKTYLSTLTIGVKPYEILPKLISSIVIKEPSIIILENNNDWNFIIGITEKYQTKKGRKEIYKLIQKNIENKWIRPRQAGGKSQIIPILEHEKTIYSDMYKYKVMALFDSDRSDSNSLNPEIINTIKKLKYQEINSPQDAILEDTDDIIWHMLYKRELENYISVNLIQEYITDASNREIEDLSSKSANELDFLKYETYFMLNKLINVKTVFPTIFNKEFNREVLERRCEHHKIKIPLPNGILEDISEIEQILLKIAKII